MLRQRFVYIVPNLGGLQIIPQIGFDSAPADMLVWVLVNYMRSQLSVGVKEVIISLEEMQYVLALQKPAFLFNSFF